MVYKNQNDLHDFLLQWREYYRSKAAKEFDPEWLWEMFRSYWAFLQAILGADHELLVCNAKQWQAYKIAVQHPESLNHRTRRGGKTLMLSHLCVFFAELGFGPGSLSGKVIYRCPHTSQLKGLLQWLKQNPFFIRRRKLDNEVLFFESQHPLDLACLSTSTSVGMECAVLIEDEYSTIKKGGELAAWVKDSRAFIAKGETWEKRHIHASSGRKNSPFEDDYEFLLKEDPEAIIVMPWAECPWITASYIAKEKRRHFMSKYWIEEQYECLWVLEGGSFFDQKKLHIVGQDGVPEDILTLCRPTSAGLDFNGSATGHVMLLMYYDQRHTIYIFKEIIFQEIFEIARWIKEHPEIAVEVEGTPTGRGGGYNAGFAATLQEMGVTATYEAWNDPEIKALRVGILHRSEVYAHPSCRWFIKNFKEGGIDKSKDIAGQTTLKKTTDQHGVDACLHGIGSAGNLDVLGPQPQDYYANQQFESFVDGVKFR